MPGFGPRLVAAALAGAALSLTGGVAAGAAPSTPAGAWQVTALHLAEAHQRARGAGVTVAVLDSRVEAHHDLRGALLPQIDVAPARTRDDAARGTQLAGLIAARGDGRDSLLGVAPESRILPVRVSGRGYDARPDAVGAGIDRAVAAGASVIVTTYSRPELTDSLTAAVRRAGAANTVVVAPAGAGTPASPTLADLPGVISVAGVDRDGQPERNSVRGLRLDVAAPAEQLVAPVHASIGDGYTQVSGSDYAAALVAGVAALVRSEYPQLAAGDVARRLHRDTRRDLSLGWGSVDAADALTRPLAELPVVKPPTAGAHTETMPRDRQWYLDAIAVPDAQRLTRGDNVTLGLLAAAVDTARPDLTGRVAQQAWLDDDGREGQPPMAARRPADTAAAVIAAGSGGDGYLGVAPAARVITASGADLEPAVRWLVDHGAKVVLVTDGRTSLPAAAAAYALSHDAVVVAPHSPDTPAVPGVITVRGVRQGEALSSGASPALSAPGEMNLLLGSGQVASASPDESAAALVAGVAALVRAQHPEADANTTIQRLLSTATPVNGDGSVAYGRGIVDPLGALTADTSPTAGNPLGDAGPVATDEDRDGRPWVVIGVVIAAGLAAIVLLAVVLHRRRRSRAVLAAQKDQAALVGESDHPPTLRLE